MKLSVNWLKKYIKIELEPQKLAERIGAQIGAVEQLQDIGSKYQGIVIAKVIDCRKHEDADKLTVCLIDDAKAIKNIKRDSRGLVQVVCGAPNVRPSQLVVWIPPGTVVPETAGNQELKLEARKIRGVMSNGMIASAKELAISDEHQTILEVDQVASPGQPFAEVYQLDDWIIDIENKMFTHRPDLFGVLGLAREVAGIQNRQFQSPDWYKANVKAPAPGKERLTLELNNQLPKLVSRFCAVAMAGVDVKPSPVWLQTYLSRLGFQPINNVVDITNYLMLETAQPLHAYDYDKLAALDGHEDKATLSVRQAKSGEKLTLLGGKQVELQTGTILIASSTKPVGLGGVKGGQATEIDETTKNIVLECANFDMNATRRSAMSYGQFTDAAVRFTKNQSPKQNMAVLARAVEMLAELTGAAQASHVIDNARKLPKTKPVKLKLSFINARLGLELSASKIEKLLCNVEFKLKIRVHPETEFEITPPFWRTDIEIAEDIVEEVGRLHGYDRLPLDLPKRGIAPTAQDDLLELSVRLRRILATAGCNELLSYSFVDGELLRAAGQDTSQAFHIRNASSPELQYYRLSLAPSLLEKISPNLRAGFERFGLFELGKAHAVKVIDEAGLPRAMERLSLVVAAGAKAQNSGAAYYQARHIVDFILQRLGSQTGEYQSLSTDRKLPAEWQAAATVFEPGRSAVLNVGDQLVGLVGEPSAKLSSSLKLPQYVATAELDVQVLLELAKSDADYKPLNKFPSLGQDICLRTEASTGFSVINQAIETFLKQAAKETAIEWQLQPVDIFQKKNELAHKQTTWHISLSHSERTLTTDKTNKLLEQLAAHLKSTTGAVRI